MIEKISNMIFDLKLFRWGMWKAISNDRVASPTDKNNDKVDSKQARECAKSSWGGPPGLPIKIKSEKI